MKAEQSNGAFPLPLPPFLAPVLPFLAAAAPVAAAAPATKVLTETLTQDLMLLAQKQMEVMAVWMNFWQHAATLGMGGGLQNKK